MNFCTVKTPNPVDFFCPPSGFTLCSGDLEMALGRGGMVLRSFWLGESGFCFGVLLPPFIMQWQEGGQTRGAAAVLDVYLWGKILGSQQPVVSI